MPEDWNERCRVDFGVAASALAALAAEGTWPTARWSQALYQWSDEEQREHGWRDLAPILVNAPTATLREPSHGLSWWLGKLAKTFEGQKAIFLALCDSLLGLDYGGDDDESDDLVGRAINHPVGHVSEGLLHWWFRNDLTDRQGLADEPRRRFARICDTVASQLRHGGVLLATHVISLFRVDREWTERSLHRSTTRLPGMSAAAWFSTFLPEHFSRLTDFNGHVINFHHCPDAYGQDRRT